MTASTFINNAKYNVLFPRLTRNPQTLPGLVFFFSTSWLVPERLLPYSRVRVDWLSSVRVVFKYPDDRVCRSVEITCPSFQFYPILRVPVPSNCAISYCAVYQLPACTLLEKVYDLWLSITSTPACTFVEKVCVFIAVAHVSCQLVLEKCMINDSYLQKYLDL